MNKLEPHLARLMEPIGFIEKFWELCSEYRTQQAAYESTEQLYMSVFGQRKYKNYESFRVNRDRILKNHKK